MRSHSIYLLAVAVLVGALGTAATSLGQVRLGDQLGGPKSPLAGLEGADSVFADPVTLSAQFTAATADRPAVLMITARIFPGWHVYSLTQPAGGPTKTNPCSSQARANAARSERNPYPGWTASAPLRAAAARMAGMDRYD